MSNNETPTLSPESQKALQEQSARTKLAELNEISRLCINTLNLICSNDISIPSAYAKPVGEIQDWLKGMHQNIQQNIAMVQTLLPAAESAPVEGSPAGDVKQAVVDQGTDKAVKLEVVDNAPTSKKGRKVQEVK